MGYPSERGADEWRRYDYDYFQSELVAAEGIHLGERKTLPAPSPPQAGPFFGGNCCFGRLGESSPGSSQTDPSLLAVWYDYIKLMPMTAEANQMSQELGKVTLTWQK